MALQKQNVAIPLAQGVDTKTDDKQLPIGRLAILENGIFQSPLKAQVRPGYDGFGIGVLGSTTNISQGVSLATYRDELLASDSSYIRSYDQGNDAWSTRGKLYTLDITANSILRNNYQQSSQDSAIHSMGLQVFAWEDTQGGVRYSVVDINTGLQVVSNQLVATNAVKPKCYAIGNYLVILYVDPVAFILKYRAIVITDPVTLGTAINLQTDINNTDYNYDASIISTRLQIAYNNNTGGITCFYLDAFLSASAKRTVGGDAASVCINVTGDSFQNVWVSYYNGTSVKAFIRDYNLSSTAVLATTTIETVASVRNLTANVQGVTGTFIYEISAAQTYNYFIRSNTMTKTGTIGTAANIVRSVGLASKCFYYNSHLLFLAAHESALQPTYFLIDSTGMIAAKISPQTGGGLTAKSILPEVNWVETGVYQISYLQNDYVSTVDANIYNNTGVMTADLNFNSDAIISQTLGNNLHMSGGYLSMYDGVSVVEHGFHLYPENVSGATSGAGGSIAAGTYQYSVVYAWTDNFGQIHRSAPSVPISVTTVGATSSNTITIPTLRLTSKQSPNASPISIELYRTEDAGDIFYRVSSVTSLTYNTTTANTVTIVDTLADASIIGNEQLYTTGGEVENIEVPAAQVIFQYKNRIIALPSESPFDYWYSKECIPGSPVEFSDSFVQSIDQKGGPLTTGAVMDDKAVLFKESDIFFFVGEGPAATGANNDFTHPQLITSDVGCSEIRSVVQTPMGLMFKSKKGIYLLGRGLEVQYIGAPVEAYNSDTVTSAVLLDNTNQVKFTLNSGVILVYDYLVNQWAVHTNLNAVDATIFQGQYTFLWPSGVVYQETPDQFTDNGNFIKMKIQTSWLSFVGLQGFQRVYKLFILGQYISAHRLKVQVAVDFDPSIVQECYVDATTLFQTDAFGEPDTENFGDEAFYGGNPQNYQFRVDMTRQKCQSVQFTIESVPEVDYGRCFSISNLALEVGAKLGLNKVPASRIISG